MHGILCTGAMVIIVGTCEGISVNRCIAAFHHTSTGVVKIQFSNLIVLKCKNMYYDQLEILNAMHTVSYGCEDKCVAKRGMGIAKCPPHTTY